MVLIGINDVLAGDSSSTIISRLETIAGLLHEPRFCTILPFGNYESWTSDKEAVRVAVNAWILANTTNPTNAESVMGDLTDPSQPVLKAEYDSGDGLHPNHDPGDFALAAAMKSQSFG